MKLILFIVKINKSIIELQMVTATEEINYIGFNQDQSCFVCGTNYGFKVYNSYPFQETCVRDLGGGLGIVEMLFRTNLLAIVGGGTTPKYPPNKLVLWDDYQSKSVGELTFKCDIKAVKLRKSKLLVVLDNKIYLYELHDLKLVDITETCYNPFGLCSFSMDGEILCCPDKEVGYVKVSDYTKKVTKSKKAHSSSVRALEISDTGSYFATASEKGTIIRVFKTDTLMLVQEFRRGTEYHRILSIAFNNEDKWIACVSNSGTIHIFNLVEPPKKELRESQKKIQDTKSMNSKSKFSFFKDLIPFLNSEWSYDKFRLQDKNAKLAFGMEPNQLIAITYEGNYYLANFQSKTEGGQFIQEKKCFLDNP